EQVALEQRLLDLSRLRGSRGAIELLREPLPVVGADRCGHRDERARRLVHHRAARRAAPNTTATRRARPAARAGVGTFMIRFYHVVIQGHVHGRMRRIRRPRVAARLAARGPWPPASQRWSGPPAVGAT